MTWGTLLAGLLGAAAAASGGEGTAARPPEPPGEAFFPWPPPPVPEEELAGPARLPAPWPRSPDLLEGPASPANDDPAARSLEPFLRIPEFLLDGAFSLAGALLPRPGRADWEEDDRRPVIRRMADWGSVPRRSPIAADLAAILAEREQRFFGLSDRAWIWTPPFDPPLEAGMDEEDLRYEQRKVILDAVRKAYLAKYRFRPEERIREDAFGFRGWSGLDFAVLPPLMAGYLYLRGLERRFSTGVLDLGVHLEPLSRWVGNREDFPAVAGLEVGIRGFPLALMVSAGLRGGDAEMDFVGVGTSWGLVRRMLRFLQGD